MNETTQAPDKKKETTFQPPVDVIEYGDRIVLVADLPGVTRKDLQIDIDKDVLSIRGPISREIPGKYTARYSEYKTGTFGRSFTLSREIDSSAITAELDRGVLELTLPKRREASAKRITVKAR